MKIKVVLFLSLILALGLPVFAQANAEPLTDAQIPEGITDEGHSRFARFLADVNNDGINDFCRAVGDVPRLFLSCQLGERVGFGSEPYAFNSHEDKTELGFAGTAWMEDVNNDGRMDYCRQVGKDPNRYYAAILAGPNGFSKEQFTRIKKEGSRWVVAPEVRQTAAVTGGGQNTRGAAGGNTRSAAGGNTRAGAPAQNTRNTAPPTAQFQNIWIDYNVTVSGRKGMRIHTKFNIQNAASKPIKLTASFEWRDGVLLKGNEAAYQSAQGNVMAVTNFTPTLANSVYNDATVFIPYSALNMSDNAAALRFRLSLYDVGTKRHIAYSQYTNFNFTK